MKTMKLWAILLSVAVAFPVAAVGPNGTQGTITAQNANVSSGTATSGSTVAIRLDIPKAGSSIYTGAPSHYGTLGIQVSGTYTGTLTFQASKDFGATWVSWYVVPAVAGTGATGTQVTTTTSTGTWSAGVSDVTDFRVTCTAYTSGTATVTLNANTNAQVVIVQSLPPLTAGTASLGTVTAVGTAASGAAVSGNPVMVGGSDGTNARTLATDTGGRQVVVGAGATGAALVGNPVQVAGSDGTNTQTLRVQANNSTASNGALVLAGRYDATLPTLTNGNVAAPELDVGGRLLVAGSAADGATIAGAPVPIGVKAIANGAAPTQVTAGQVAYPVATLDRIPYVANFHPNLINCNVAVSTATTLTALGGNCAAPGASLSIYVTDVHFAASVDSDVTTADALPTLKYGTGGSCGAGTAVFWSAGTLAKTTVVQHFGTPIKIPANNEICWIHSVAGSKVLGIQGFIAP